MKKRSRRNGEKRGHRNRYRNRYRNRLTQAEDLWEKRYAKNSETPITDKKTSTQ